MPQYVRLLYMPQYSKVVVYDTGVKVALLSVEVNCRT
jgi:hypothetical protein